MSRYVVFLLGLFVIAAILRIDFFFTVGYLLFGLYVLGRLWVRRGLQVAGFDVQRVPGHGRKRQMLVGRLIGQPERPCALTSAPPPTPPAG